MQKGDATHWHQQTTPHRAQMRECFKQNTETLIQGTSCISLSLSVVKLEGEKPTSQAYS